MSRLVTKSDALKNALFSIGVGVLVFWIGASTGGTSAGMFLASIFWMTGAVFWFWYRHLVKRDRRLAQRNPAEVAPKLPAAPPKASPQSSSFDLPEFD